MLASNFYSDVLFLPTCSVWFGNAMIPIDTVSDYFHSFQEHRVREMSDLDFLRILPSDSSPSFTIAFGIHHFFGSLGNPSIFSHSKSKFMDFFSSGFIWVASIPGDAQHSWE